MKLCRYYVCESNLKAIIADNSSSVKGVFFASFKSYKEPPSHNSITLQNRAEISERDDRDEGIDRLPAITHCQIEGFQ